MGLFSRKPDENLSDVNVTGPEKSESVVSVLRQRLVSSFLG